MTLFIPNLERGHKNTRKQSMYKLDFRRDYGLIRTITNTLKLVITGFSERLLSFL